MTAKKTYNLSFRGKQEKTEKKCAVCGESFLGYADRLYCSPECKKRKAAEKARSGICASCGTKIDKRFKKCGKCYYKRTTFQCNQIKKMKREGKTVKQIAQLCNCSIFTVYYSLKKK